MSAYIFELPTTGSFTFADILIDKENKYAQAIANATAARASVRSVLKASKRAEDSQKDYLRLVKILDDYLPYLYGVIGCIAAGELELTHQPIFSWRTTLTNSMLKTSPRLSLVGFQADVAYTLLTYSQAMFNLATIKVASLGTYERERAISDKERQEKDEELNIAVQFYFKASSMFKYIGDEVLSTWEKELSTAPSGGSSTATTTPFVKPVDLTRELLFSLSKFAQAESQSLAIRKRLSRSAYDSTLTPGPPLPQSHPPVSFLAKLQVCAHDLYSSAHDLAKSARGIGVGTGIGIEVTKDLTRHFAGEITMSSALAHKWLGVDAGEVGGAVGKTGKAGESVGWLRWAKAELEDMKKDSGSHHGLSYISSASKERKERVSEELQSVSAFLNHYQKMNDSLHFEKVPEVATLQSSMPSGLAFAELKPYKPSLPVFGPGSPGFMATQMSVVRLDGDSPSAVNEEPRRYF